MAVDVEALLAPVSDSNPVGEDLAYDSVRLDIEQAFERSASGSSANEGDVDWRSVLSLIEDQNKRTKDIWLAVYMIRAGAKMARLDVVDRGSAFLAGLLSAYWAQVHPQIDEYGFQGRKSPLESLTRIGEFLGPLKTIVLVSHPRLGQYTSNDLERFAVNGDSEDGYGMFRAAVAEMPEEELAAVRAQLDSIAANLRTADRVMTENSGSETSVNFLPTYDALAAIRRNLTFFMDGSETAEPAAVADDGAPPSSPVAAAPARGSGAVESREDVIRALDAIADYYRRKEPSSPVPLALRRAREWVTLDFMAVIEDIAPNSVDDVRRILVSNRNAENGY
jgi:type VI secretion system protein ImpA